MLLECFPSFSTRILAAIVPPFNWRGPRGQMRLMIGAQVARYCEKLPLALALSRELRTCGKFDWAGLRKGLEEARKKFEKKSLSDEEKVVFSAMDAFFDQLPRRHRGQLQHMVVVAPHVPVTREILMKLWDTVRSRSTV